MKTRWGFVALMLFLTVAIAYTVLKKGAQNPDKGLRIEERAAEAELGLATDGGTATELTPATGAEGAGTGAITGTSTPSTTPRQGQVPSTTTPKGVEKKAPVSTTTGVEKRTLPSVPGTKVAKSDFTGKGVQVAKAGETSSGGSVDGNRILDIVREAAALIAQGKGSESVAKELAELFKEKGFTGGINQAALQTILDANKDNIKNVGTELAKFFAQSAGLGRDVASSIVEQAADAAQSSYDSTMEEQADEDSAEQTEEQNQTSEEQNDPSDPINDPGGVSVSQP